jgi:radical SAM superfamily enzyme YgiQ (UPF0313 family)
MRVLLISTYELGHQPIHVASPAAALTRRGHDVACIDTAIDPWDPTLVDGIDAVAISVPMHTALRLATGIAETIRARRPGLPICFYGLYAAVARHHTLGPLADRVITGEYETALCDWVDGRADTTVTYLHREHTEVPARQLLPPLDRYARLALDGEERLAAAVEASHGCSSRCRHCPVPAVYDGRTRIVAPDTVLTDIDQAVDLGARHISFADPDVLSAPQHWLRIARALHYRHPDLTFDITTKVEHILRHDTIWDEVASLGCLFVTTAVECVDDTILTIIDKRHTAHEAANAVAVLRHAGIEPRPTLLPFTPWTTLDGLADLAAFVITHDLTASIDPVQWTLRLLIPDGSLLLDHPALAPHLDGYDPQRLGWRWTAADPRIDDLHHRLTEIVDRDTACGAEPNRTFDEITATISRAAGRPLPGPTAAQREGRPRLTETWFCCAEPTCEQQARTAVPVLPRPQP